MKRKRVFAARVGLVTALFVLASFRSAPIIPSRPDALPPPSAEEIAILRELYDWVLGGSGEADFHPFARVELADAIRARRQSFELFRRYNSKEARRELLDRIPYGELIFETAQRHEVDSLLLAAVVEAESQFDPDAVSPQGAVGLMQIMPSTAGLYGGKDPREPAANVEIGARYLRSLLEGFDGDLELALAAYNAGPSNVARYGGVPPYRETRAYVDKVLGRYIEHHQAIWESSGATDVLRAP